ncbi:hypothetical protein [Mycolicibacterium iranicum]|uniref:PE-PPE domain-containing protein n=1 Tax=Mycolicibacterium iranicum TaxID=912594 RepID=A0A1X1W9L7_MYCIR|nr:hypothetical protein [Mycolicibacterium iranicum]ORV83218.1 hypothetical protein AWC12_26750 [Mycolicibacterium iranicum]
MRVAVKPVITTSVALVGASVIAVTPIQAPAPTVRAIESDVSLSASSVAYVPVNMIQQALSAPANMVASLDRLAAAMVISGDWNVNQPNNQWGWDEANPAMLMELVNTVIPFPHFSEPFGRHLNWWATANLPMYEGCNFECPDLPGMLTRMFRVPMSEFYDEDGYTFPVVRTPYNGIETTWSRTPVKLDPAEPIRSLWDSLTSEPEGVKSTTLWEFVSAVANFSAAMQVTGHLPDWIAVREIETFVKLFLRPPAEAADDVDTPSDATDLELVANTVAPADEALDGQSPALALRSFSFDAAGGTDGADIEQPIEKPGDDGTLESETTSIVDTATSFLKGKFASVQEDEAHDGEAVADEAEDTATTEDTTAKDTHTVRSRGKRDLVRDSSAAADSEGGGSTSGDDSGSGSGGSANAGSGGSGGGDTGGES